MEKGMQHGQKIVFEGQADEAVSFLSKLNVLPVLSTFLFFIRFR